MVGGDAAFDAKRQAGGGEKPQELGRLINDAHQAKFVPLAAVGQSVAGRIRKRAVGPRDRVAMRIDLGMAKCGVDAIDQ